MKIPITGDLVGQKIYRDTSDDFLQRKNGLVSVSLFRERISTDIPAKAYDAKLETTTIWMTRCITSPFECQTLPVLDNEVNKPYPKWRHEYKWRR